MQNSLQPSCGSFSRGKPKRKIAVLLIFIGKPTRKVTQKAILRFDLPRENEPHDGYKLFCVCVFMSHVLVIANLRFGLLRVLEPYDAYTLSTSACGWAMLSFLCVCLYL